MADNSVHPRLQHTFRTASRTDLRGICSSPDGNTFAVATATGVHLYDWGAPRRKPKSLRQHGAVRVNPPTQILSDGISFHSVAYDVSGRNLIGASTGEIRIWDLTQLGRHNLTVLSGHIGDIGALAVAATGPRHAIVASGGDDGNVMIWDLRKGRLVLRVSAFDSPVEALAYTSSGRYLLVGSIASGTNFFFVDPNGARSRHVEIAGGVTSLAVDPQDINVAIGTRSGPVEIRMVGQRDYAVTLEGHTTAVTAVAFTADGKFLVSRSLDQVRVWSTDTWDLVTFLAAQIGSTVRYGRAALNPRTDSLVLTNEDLDLVAWDLGIGDARQTRRFLGSVRHSTRKVALVGDSGVGKTTLGYRLIHGTFKPQESTHGQQFWVLKALSGIKDLTMIEVVLWDFAGQPEYRIVHSLFLDNIDCALILLDSTHQEEPLRGVQYWLRQLESLRQGLPPAVLVGARRDRGTPAISRKDIESFCQEKHILGGYIETSAKTGEGISTLLKAVGDLLDSRPSSLTVTSNMFHVIKSHILAIKARLASTRVLISVDEIARMIQDEDDQNRLIDPRVVDTVLRALRNQGFIELLDGGTGHQFVLLSPDVMIGLASSVILEARRNQRGLGALNERDLLEGRYALGELNGLNLEDRNIMLDSAVLLFVKANVCFRESLGADSYLVFPSLINQIAVIGGRSDAVDDVTYRVVGPTVNIFAALVVLLGYTNTFRRTRQWRDHAEYELSTDQVCGFRQSFATDEEIELVLYYGASTNDSTRMLFQGLVEDILRRRNVTVERFPRAVCGTCKTRQERSTVVRRIRSGRPWVSCEECGEQVPLQEPVDITVAGVESLKVVDSEGLVARGRTTYQAALVRLKGAIRDRGLSQPECFISYAWEDDEIAKWVQNLQGDLSDAGVEVVLDVLDNSAPGSSIPRFISRLETVQFIAVIGTPAYRKKYFQNEVGTVVGAEMDLIGARLLKPDGVKRSVIPILKAGSADSSFPPQFGGRVYLDFSSAGDYFMRLLDLVVALYGLPARDPAVAAARSILEKRGATDAATIVRPSRY